MENESMITILKQQAGPDSTSTNRPIEVELSDLTAAELKEAYTYTHENRPRSEHEAVAQEFAKRGVGRRSKPMPTN